MLNQVDTTQELAMAQDGTVTINCDPNSVAHTFTIKANTATAGTVAVTFIPKGLTTAETLLDQYGAAVTQNLASVTQRTYRTDGMVPLKTLVFTMTGGNGTATIIKSDS